MKSEKTRVIGLMSGTSLDGIDLVCVDFDTASYEKFAVIFSETISYSPIWKETLQQSINFSDERLLKLDKEYGVLLSDNINKFISKNDIKNIDFIASHGHTVFHKPELGITLQIGNGQEIATKTKHKVVCDFRSQDVALGGQGAPLVPIGDALLFSEYDSCLNLGGFANISFQDGDKRIAFDICPANIVLNHYVTRLGYDYDNRGKIASSGEVNVDLLKALNVLEYYSVDKPKSLGLEWVLSDVFPLIDAHEKDIQIVLRTFTEHIAIQISDCLKDKNDVLVTGGGVFNTFLIERIKAHSNAKIVKPNNEIIDFKEALIFAFLGLLRIENQINCLSSVTGAKRDHSSGELFYP